MKAVDDVSLRVAPGSFVSLLGPSGSGKTTTLNLIAGFITPTSGDLLIDGVSVSAIPPHKRNIGMVFQAYALFPHMTVSQNVGYPLKMRTKLSATERQDRIVEALKLVRLAGLADRFPAQLSGGQQQRVAMARALVSSPRLLLMDEPLGALDKGLREDLQLEIKEIHSKLGSTIIYVTHDQTEALTMSDFLVVMRNAKIEQIGPPQAVYENPDSVFVASFLGTANLLPLGVVGMSADRLTGRLANGEMITIPTQSASSFSSGDAACLLIRPEDVKLSPCNSGKGLSPGLRAKLVDTMFHGDHSRVTLDLAGAKFTVQLHPAQIAEFNGSGDVFISWSAERARLIPADR